MFDSKKDFNSSQIRNDSDSSAFRNSRLNTERLEENRPSGLDASISEIILNSLTRNIPDIVYRLNPDGAIAFINDSINMYGFEDKELLGHNIIDLVHPDDRDLAWYNVRERRVGERRTKSFEIRLLNKDQMNALANGEHINGNGNNLFSLEAEGIYQSSKSGGRNFIGTQGIARDITENRITTRNLNTFLAILEYLNEAVIITNKHGIIEYMNPAFIMLSGQNAGHLIGEKYDKLPDTIPVYDELTRIIESQEKTNGAFLSRNINRQDTILAFPIQDDSGKIINFAAIERGKTIGPAFNVQLQKSQKMEAIGQLAGGIAHDFNNILTVINGYAELMLARMENTDPFAAYIRQILKSGNRARDLIRQLLAFSRKEIIDPKIIAINDVISDIQKMLHRLIGEDIELKTILADNLPAIKADPGQIEQILINLTINGRDAIYQQKIKQNNNYITIETQVIELDEEYASQHPGSHPGLYVALIVSDNGAGMDKNTMSQIFEPFFTTKEEMNGTGLGLAMVFGVVKQNNGSIYVYSEPGKGSSFKIFWPASGQGVQKKPASEYEVSGAEGSESVLIVEDDETVRNFTVSALEELGYRVHSANNGPQALCFIKEQNLHIDLLITAAVMPKMSGRQLAKNVEKLLPSVKVLYTSGYTDDYIVRHGELLEGVNFVQKPYTGNTLAKRVRAVFDQLSKA